MTRTLVHTKMFNQRPGPPAVTGSRPMRTPYHIALFCLLVVFAIGIVANTAQAQSCTADDLGETVDRIGASLRALDRKSSKRFQPKLAALAKKKKMTMPVAESWVWQTIRDPRITEFDQKIDALVGNIDRLSDPKDPAQNCQAIEKLNTAEKQLLSLMQQRSDFVLAELDKKIAGDHKQAKPDPATAAAPKPAANPQQKSTAKPQAPAKPPNVPQRDWNTEVAANPEPGLALVPDAPLPGEAYPALDTTFSVSEISDAGSGLFGNVSSHIAAAINGAFATFGQPNAYVTGTEGGGAFLAGLRYGKGHVHFKDGTRQQVFWNGPSLGYDLGADGSRVMFLIYNLQSAEQLFIRYPGVDGAAYLAGGVGVTVLRRNGITIVPIRSGVGLRLGANVSYLRFSSNRRWNPF